MFDIYEAARARGAYEAIGGHKFREAFPTRYSKDGRPVCGVCGREGTWREPMRHYTATPAAEVKPVIRAFRCGCRVCLCFVRVDALVPCDECRRGYHVGRREPVEKRTRNA